MSFWNLLLFDSVIVADTLFLTIILLSLLWSQLLRVLPASASSSFLHLPPFFPPPFSATNHMWGGPAQTGLTLLHLNYDLRCKGWPNLGRIISPPFGALDQSPSTSVIWKARRSPSTRLLRPSWMDSCGNKFVCAGRLKLGLTDDLRRRRQSREVRVSGRKMKTVTRHWWGRSKNLFISLEGDIRRCSYHCKGATWIKDITLFCCSCIVYIKTHFSRPKTLYKHNLI